jgi:hypothetical protein
MKFADQLTDLLEGADKVVTKAMHQWDGVMTKEAILRVAEQEINDNSVAGDLEKSSGLDRIRPSLIGRCQRMQALSMLDYPQLPWPAGTLALMEDGTQRGYVWQKRGLSAGFLVDIETYVELPELHIGGRIDGLMVDDSIFECKVVNSNIYNQAIKDKAPMYKHLMQVHGYMAARGTNKASVLYEQRGFDVTWHEYRITWDEAIWDDLVATCRGILTRVDRGELPPMLEVCEPRSGYTFTSCSFHAVCPSATATKETK